MFGCARLGGGQQGRVVDGEVTVILFQDGQSRPLQTGENGGERGRRGENTGSFLLTVSDQSDREAVYLQECDSCLHALTS